MNKSLKVLVLFFVLNLSIQNLYAESNFGSSSASASINIRVIIPEITKIISSESVLHPVTGQKVTKLVIWSNVKNIFLNGKLFRLTLGTNILYLETDPLQNSVMIATP